MMHTDVIKTLCSVLLELRSMTRCHQEISKLINELVDRLAASDASKSSLTTPNFASVMKLIPTSRAITPSPEITEPTNTIPNVSEIDDALRTVDRYSKLLTLCAGEDSVIKQMLDISKSVAKIKNENERGTP